MKDLPSRKTSMDLWNQICEKIEAASNTRAFMLKEVLTWATKPLTKGSKD
jgi:hypothetical protein